MKRIIAVYGHAQCGKTTTLNYVRELLRANGTSLSTNPPYKGDQPETFKFKDHTICICPGGDNGDIINSNFEYAIAKNADIIITASRTKGQSVNNIIKYAKQLQIEKIEWYIKCYENYLGSDIQKLCNEKFAEFIFGVI